MLDVRELTIAYGSQTVLHAVSFHLPPGKILAVIGPNGAGKSTLIRALSGVVPVEPGAVWVQGSDLSGLSTQERARRIAVVPQAIALPPAFTAWETVLIGRTPHLGWLGNTSAHDEEITRAAMVRTHTLELAERRVGELSGGEQQRLLLARALAQSAPILLLDEPTAHLDLQYQLTLLDEVRTLVRQDGLTVLAALHDLNLVARYADLVVLLVGGCIHALGTPVEVLTAGLLSEAYQVPLQVHFEGARQIPYILPRD